MTNLPQKLPMHTPDFTKENIAQLAELFPHCVTESHDENKQPKRVIDFDMLRAELSGEMIEGLDERYHLNWPGKRAALLAMRAPVAKTLRPKRDDSEGFDKTQNLFIEGDNLDALRLLQKSYLSKVKMIYIDPPYNTGNDFIYKDDFKEKTGEYLLESEQTDEDGNRLETNTESNGRFHSDWLSMMYPRLKLARNLLRDDGVIFISIDDNEQANLKKLCDEIFGAENFVACVANISNPKGRSDDKYVATAHEYILIYKKNDLSFGGWKPDEKIIKRFNKIDDRGEIYREIDLRKTGDNDRREDRPNMYYALFYDKNSGSLEVGEHDDNNPEKIKILPKKEDGLDGCWRWGKETTQQNLDNLVARYMPVRKRWSVFQKDYLKDKTSIKPTSAWSFKEVNSERGSEQFIDLGFYKGVFPKPKPVGTLFRMITLATLHNNNDIILDFFAGSGTTAHATMQLNAEDGGNRKFICVQLPEIIDEKSDAFQAGYKNIAEITKERIRRAGQKILKNPCHPDWNKDIGFRTFAIDSTNMNDVYYYPQDITQKKLPDMVKNIKGDRSPEDLLFQVMADWGMDLSLPFKTEQIEGAGIFFVDGKTLVACLDSDNATISIDFCKDLALRKPQRVIFLDASFSSSSVKASVAGIFKTLSKDTDLKVL